MKDNIDNLKDYALAWLTIGAFYTWFAFESDVLVMRENYEKILLNKNTICINEQEKQKDFNWTINIGDLKSCVLDNRKIVKNELENTLNI